MKVILLIALFAIAAQAAINHDIYEKKPFNFTGHFYGFAQGLNLTESQMQLATKCHNDLVKDEQVAESLVKSHEVSPMSAVEVYSLFDNVKNNLGPDCQGYFNELVHEVVRRNPNITHGDIKRNVFENAKNHAAFVSQTIFSILDSIIAGRQSTAGHQEAHLFMILTGLINPQPHATRDFKTLNFTEIAHRVHNQTNETIEVLTGYFNATGRTNQTTLQRTIKCSLTQNALLEKLKQIKHMNKDLLTQVQSLTEMIELGSRYARDCKVQWEILEPQLKALMRDPIHIVARIIHNIGLGAPELVQLSKEIAYDALSGDFYAAGRRSGIMENNLAQGL